MALSAAQRAIEQHAGPAVVLAGPGSGKTTTSIAKILHILRADRRHRVVAVTFTRDGANEIQRRFVKRAEPDMRRRVLLGTFHKLTFDHLEAHGKLPKMASPAQARGFLARISHLAPEGDRPNIQLVFEEIKCSFRRHPRAEERWFQQYEAMLARHGLRDFYDVMRDAVLAMQAGTLPLLDCTHLIGDEAQDVDEVQFQWMLLHARAGVTVTLIGDDDQTIYEWRRALGYAGMMSFAEQTGAALLPLTENYRSLANIITHADTLVRNNSERVPKDFDPKRGPGGTVHSVIAGSLIDQADMTAKWLEGLAVPLEGEEGSRTPLGFPDRTIAVLARNNVDINVIQSTLFAWGIRHYRPSGSMWDLAPVRCFFSLLSATETGDTAALDEVLGACRVSEEGIQHLLTEIQGSLFGWLDQPANKGPLGDVDWHTIKSVHQCMRGWRSQLADGGERIALATAQEWVLSHFAFGKSGVDVAERILGTARKRLLQLKGRMTARIALMTREAKQQSPEHAVHLMTMHGAKGLEWDTVGIFRADDSTIPGDSARAMDAERRLFYVAMTRARDQLVIFSTASQTSRFVREADLTSTPELPAVAA